MGAEKAALRGLVLRRLYLGLMLARGRDGRSGGGGAG